MQPFGQASVDVVTGVSYLPFGPISSYTLGNGQTVTRSYDANYALTDVVSPALALHFARDAMGNITALGAAPGATPATETYSYDPLYRLTGVQDAAGNTLEAYTYPTGDRLSKTGGLYAAGTYGYEANTHHLTSIGNALRTVDADGNTTASTVGAMTYGFTYNDRNRLGTVQQDGATVVTYAYNALGQRIGKTPTGGSVQRFAYDEASHIVGEYGTTSRDYVWLDDLPIAVADKTGTTATLDYVHADGLGTPRAVSDANGTTVWTWPYAGNPFGEQPPTSTGGYTLNLRYPGQYFDAESGTDYNYYRTYEPASGRYLQPDPMGQAAGPSLYAYVGGNPFGYIDPLGLDWYYQQSNGQLTHVDNNGIATDYGYGYSGNGAGLNWPGAQNMQGIGPIPQGTYTIDPQQNNVTNSGHRLLQSMRLTPDPGNEMFGRGGFLIHGDNSRGNQSASEGCMIFNHNVRNIIGQSNDHILHVFEPIAIPPPFFPQE